MAAGWTYSGSRRLESSAMKCDMRGCKLVESTDGVSKVLTIPVGLTTIIKSSLVSRAVSWLEYKWPTSF